MVRSSAAYATILALAITFTEVLAQEEGTVRRYYIQAEKDWFRLGDDWTNNCTGQNYTSGSELYMQQGIGAVYLHAIYVAYTDDTFTTKYVRPTDEEHLGITGPLLRVVEGDTLEVHFRNLLDFEVNFSPTGLELSENDTEPVSTNETKIYSWSVTDRVAPGADEPSSKLWLYMSSVDIMVHQNMGLVGAMLVTRNGEADPEAKPLDTDIELFALFHVFDENINLFFEETLAYYNVTDPLAQSNLSQAMWEEANLKHAINGKMFCWNDGFTIPEGKRARWHLAVIGGEPDIHNIHFHGMVLNHTGVLADQFTLFAGSTLDADMVTDNPGTWLLHCHVNDHIHAGMVGLYTLEGTPRNQPDQGEVVEYYLAADEVEWDYVPTMADLCSGVAQPLDEDALAQLQPSNFSLQMGGKRIKAVFQEYTDGSFTVRKDKDPALGFLGPTLRAKVGDTIRVHYRNNVRFTTSLHPHGVLYAKDSEGSPYNDGTSGAMKADDHLHTGEEWTYTWHVTERAAPGARDGSSVMWMYHSHSHEIQDSYAGLMGAIIITRRGMATADNRPRDVDREYVLSFGIIDETASFMLRANLQRFLPNVPPLQYKALAIDTPAFSDSNSMHTINGLMYCNGPSFNASVGERVRFYIMTLGTEADLHTPNVLTSQWMQQGHKSNALISIPGGMQTADVVAQAPGTWLVQCKTSQHTAAGMRALFVVQEADVETPAFNGTERVAYVAATEVEWDYIPSGINRCSGEEFDEETAAQWGPETMGHTYLKAVYREFTDDSFETPVPQRNPSDGIAGPTLHAEVGDMITIVFQNNLSVPVNLQLSGGLIAVHNASLTDAAVEPGESQTYSWIVPAEAGPGAEDLSTIAYSYSSSVDAAGDVNAGLVGVLVVGRTGTLGPDGLPVGVDYEIPLFFQIIDEAVSSLFDANVQIKNFTVPDETYDYEDFSTWSGTTAFQTINGFIFCNQPDIVLNVSSLVRFILVGIGGELDLHTPLFTNQVLLGKGSAVYTTQLAPTVSMVVDMHAEFIGAWQYRCNVQEHYEGGMAGLMVIQDPAQQARSADTATRKLAGSWL